MKDRMKDTGNVKEKTTDRRVKRTKKAFKDALADLLMEKELKSITVKELTDRADLSRGAFYRHYEDIFDLYDQMGNELISDIDQIMRENSSHDYDEIYRTMIDYVYNNASIWHSFMCGSSSSRFRIKLIEFFQNRYEQIVLYEMKTEELKMEWKYIIQYLNGGFIHALIMWIESGFSISKEALFEIVKGIDDACDPLYDLV